MPNVPDSPHAAIAAMIAELTPRPSETIPTPLARGRVLAQTILSDRPSPPCSVSAMDGYAIRAEDAHLAELPVLAEARIGCPPPEHTPRSATRIFTGSPVPPGANAVVKREEAVEHSDRIELRLTSPIAPGLHIRQRAENAPVGAIILEPGNPVTPAAMAALAMFAVARVRVHRPVRVALVITGNELRDAIDPIDEFTIRDSNGPTIASTIQALPWAQTTARTRADDAEPALRDALARSLSDADALIVSGGVSMGAFDLVPAALSSLACRVVFHRLPQRPGRPMLGAIGPDGQAILALPGNPVSVLCTLHRLGLPILRHVAGLERTDTPTLANLSPPIERPLDLWSFRPVRLTSPGVARPIDSKGSGDVPAIAMSDGFVEIPPDVLGPGPFPYRPWVV